jgi:hypothetical protein
VAGLQQAGKERVKSRRLSINANYIWVLSKIFP